MKISIDDNGLETNVTNQKEFTINVNPIMFQLLSGKIYNNPKRACMMEIISNAWDATKEVGKDETTIEVHFPSALEPYFSVKDYAKGLSEEDVFNIYTTYGASTKNNNNDLCGGFGIGSKAPFAYDTKTFSIVSRHDGTLKKYSAFINERGIPSITKVYQTSHSKDDCGLEVIVPMKSVSSHDAQDLFLGFNKLPIIKNSNDTFNTFYDNNDTSYLLVRVGCYVYKRYSSNEMYKGFYLRASRVDIPIGVLDLGVSREDIQSTKENDIILKEYCDKEVSRLKDKIDSVSTPEDFFDLYEGDISNRSYYVRCSSKISRDDFVKGNFICCCCSYSFCSSEVKYLSRLLGKPIIDLSEDVNLVPFIAATNPIILKSTDEIKSYIKLNYYRSIDKSLYSSNFSWERNINKTFNIKSMFIPKPKVKGIDKKPIKDTYNIRINVCTHYKSLYKDYQTFKDERLTKSTKIVLLDRWDSRLDTNIRNKYCFIAAPSKRFLDIVKDDTSVEVYDKRGTHLSFYPLKELKKLLIPKVGIYSRGSVVSSDNEVNGILKFLQEYTCTSAYGSDAAFDYYLCNVTSDTRIKMESIFYSDHFICNRVRGALLKSLTVVDDKYKLFIKENPNDKLAVKRYKTFKRKLKINYSIDVDKILNQVEEN